MTMASIVILVALASLLAAAVTGLIVALLLRRSAGASGDPTFFQAQLASSVEALRAEVRAGLDGTAQTLHRSMSQLAQDVDRRLADVGGEMGRRLDTTSGMIGQRLEGAARAVAEVHQKLGTVQGATERVLEIGKDIASLQQILRAPKLRGALGELFLGELLGQVLPVHAFALQHSFRSGHRVDAIVRAGERLIPVDAKFPLENFTRIDACPDDGARAAARRAFVQDVRRRIDEIASRYILPEEGTFDFALMYVPAENVYYETIVRQPDDGGEGIYEYSLRRRVVPVSPNTLYSYLQVILLGLRGLQIEESAHEILRALGGLGGDLQKFRADFQVVGRHLDDTAKKFSEAGRKLQRLQESVDRLETLGERADPDLVAPGKAAEKPDTQLVFPIPTVD